MKKNLKNHLRTSKQILSYTAKSRDVQKSSMIFEDVFDKIPPPHREGSRELSPLFYSVNIPPSSVDFIEICRKRERTDQNMHNAPISTLSRKQRHSVRKAFKAKYCCVYPINGRTRGGSQTFTVFHLRFKLHQILLSILWNTYFIARNSNISDSLENINAPATTLHQATYIDPTAD